MLEALIATVSNAVRHAVRHAVRTIRGTVNRRPWLLPVAIAAVFLVW